VQARREACEIGGQGRGRHAVCKYAGKGVRLGDEKGRGLELGLGVRGFVCERG
jgi:hypothetical protein